MYTFAAVRGKISRHPARSGIVLAAVLVSLVGVVVVGWRAWSGGKSRPTLVYNAVPGVSDAENEAVAYLWNTIQREAMETGRLTNDRTDEVIRIARTNDSPFVRQWAIGVFTQSIMKGVRISPAARDRIQEQYLNALVDENWRVRIAAANDIHTAGLLDIPALREAVRSLLDDERPEVASRVMRIDWDALDRAGGN